MQDLILDIPLAYRTIDKYRTTLGHKANHKFGQINTDFMVVDHPLFGGIGGLVARDVIEEDEEIFVDYRYDPQSSPQWYKDHFLEYNKKQKEELETIEEEMREFYKNYGILDYL